MSNPLVSVIIPTYNGMAHLEACISSILESKYQNMEVILVDDGSTDGSADYIEERFPSVRILRNPTNIGVAASYNTGIVNSGGEYVSLLSNDMETDPNWLQPLLDVMEEHHDVAAADSWFLDYYDRERFDTVAAGGRYVDYFGNVMALGAGRLHKNYDKRVRRVFAGMALVRKKVLKEIGLLDPDFFFGYEDIDLFWRMNIAGYKAVCVPSSIIYHKSGASSRKGVERRSGFYFLEKRNRVLSLVKNLPKTSLIAAIPVISLEYASYFVYWTLVRNKRNVTELARCISWLLQDQNIRYLSQKRKETRSKRDARATTLRAFLVPYCGDLMRIVGGQQTLDT